MTIMKNTWPKGYNRKAWEHFYKEAEIKKQWALDTIKTGVTWANNTSDSSIQMLGGYLYLSAHELAKEAHDYCHMRAHGETFLGALDPSARRRWESITGKRVLLHNTWGYDHTVNRTSASYVNKKWVSRSGTDCNYKKVA